MVHDDKMIGLVGTKHDMDLFGSQRNNAGNMDYIGTGGNKRDYGLMSLGNKKNVDLIGSGNKNKMSLLGGGNKDLGLFNNNNKKKQRTFFSFQPQYLASTLSNCSNKTFATQFDNGWLLAVVSFRAIFDTMEC